MNERNKPDKLRETYIKGQLRYHKQQSQNAKERMPPPNCDNRGYMIDTQFCNPDGLCRTIKNPAQYAKKKAWLANNARPKARAKKKSDDDGKAEATERKKSDEKKDDCPYKTSTYNTSTHISTRLYNSLEAMGNLSSATT